jgi:hypothetical protein
LISSLDLELGGSKEANNSSTDSILTERKERGRERMRSGLNKQRKRER